MEGLMDERSLVKLCDMMLTFAKEVGYGLRAHNREVTADGGTGGELSLHGLALLLRRIPEDADYPLAFAANSLQAFNVCAFVLASYVNWTGTDGTPMYQWSTNIIRDYGVTTQVYVTQQLENVLKDQRSNGFSAP